MNSIGDRTVDQLDSAVGIADLEHELPVMVIAKLDRDRLVRVRSIETRQRRARRARRPVREQRR
jgi:hypothetical protein